MTEYEGELDGTHRSFAIVVSRYNSLITSQLLAGARACLTDHGVSDDDIHVYHVPGAWEIPQAARRVLEVGEYDALLGLGCVIRGETPHFDFVAGEAALGLGELGRTASVPVVFGVLTTDTVEQAMARAGTGAGNKGREAALSALEMVGLFRKIGEDRTT